MSGEYGFRSALYSTHDSIKTLHNKPVDPRSLSFGFLFFPGEAPSAKELRLQLKETDTGEVHLLKMKL
jgi:hypothetical protein